MIWWIYVIIYVISVVVSYILARVFFIREDHLDMFLYDVLIIFIPALNVAFYIVRMLLSWRASINVDYLVRKFLFINKK